jgi:prepilin-type N-terminal cleavage/methylation domain-containing protein
LRAVELFMVCHTKDMLKYNTAIKILGRSRENREIQGTTLAEVLVAIVIVGVLAAIAAPSVFSQGSKPLPDTVNQVAGVLRSARAMATAQTSPIKVRPLNNVLDTAGKSNGGSSTQLEILRATSTNAVCNSETGWAVDRTLTADYLKFGRGITLAVATINGVTTKNTVNLTQPADATAWQVCFNTRGVASTTSTSTMNFQGDDIILTFRQTSPTKTQTLEIFPSGGIQVNGN